jgi:hypothetical protein
MAGLHQRGRSLRRTKRHHFESAACLEAIDALSKIFPLDKFILKYFEPGVGFAGSSHISNGVRVDHEIPENDVLKFGSDEFGFSTEY